MRDFTLDDLRTIERTRDLPPDQDDEINLDSDPYDREEDDDDQSVT